MVRNVRRAISRLSFVERDVNPVTAVIQLVVNKKLFFKIVSRKLRKRSVCEALKIPPALPLTAKLKLLRYYFLEFYSPDEQKEVAAIVAGIYYMNAFRVMMRVGYLITG